MRDIPRRARHTDPKSGYQHPDLYFLLREGPLRDQLLGCVRSKFDVAPHRLGLAARLLLARDIKELPTMIRRVTLEQLIQFFEGEARKLARSEQE